MSDSKETPPAPAKPGKDTVKVQLPPPAPAAKPAEKDKDKPKKDPVAAPPAPKQVDLPPIPPSSEPATQAPVKKEKGPWAWIALIIGLLLLILVVLAITVSTVLDKLQSGGRHPEVSPIESVEDGATGTPETEEGPRERVQDLNNYRRQTGGSVVRYIGPAVQKGGRTYLPLFKDPNHKGALTEPIEKSVSSIQANMSFIGVKPPAGGKLAVYDVVRNPQTGELYNILAWEISRP